MNSNSYPMTRECYNKMSEELSELKKQRYEVAQEIDEARAQGDLSENAEYDEAKNKQGMLEARIRDIESKLSVANVIDPSKLNNEKVYFGKTVLIENTSTEEEFNYQIVSEDEADIKNGKISNISPLGRQLIGKQVGDLVNVSGKEYEIVDIF